MAEIKPSGVQFPAVFRRPWGPVRAISMSPFGFALVFPFCGIFAAVSSML